ncbi:MAG: hypothetical protein FD143_549 [Ignavibacteria bacterium]|nr:MAG: hypothetical protein FD143_549 [Ignavibacteria bacterium]KAF0161620.1 MAG: hypothetical protein FD188_737 [Ignavibacteria bacterium]
MKFMKNTFLLISAAFLFSCGESTVELEQTYEPKIVVNAIIYPGQKVANISLTRNIPLNTQPNPLTLFLNNANVSITDLSTGKIYTLTYNAAKLSYEYKGNDWIVDYDKSYKLSVNAAFDGKTLSAESVTKTPRKGFSIVDSETISGEIYYREKDKNNYVKEIPLKINLSPGTKFYPISITALDASDTTFIYNNAYVEVEREDVKKELDRYKYMQRQIQNVNPTATQFKFDINWISIWFYSRYRLVVYAADENFRLYNLTYRNVQEFDGNFHEPRINFLGDAIGVFGSMIADTVYFKVKK